jgi:hypothetical protein
MCVTELLEFEITYSYNDMEVGQGNFSFQLKIVKLEVGGMAVSILKYGGDHMIDNLALKLTH